MTDREKNEAYLKDKGYEYNSDTKCWFLKYIRDMQKWYTAIPNEYLNVYPHENFVRLVENAAKKVEHDPVRI